MTAQDKALKENTASAPLQIVAPGTCVETGEQATLVLGMYDHLVETIHQYNPSADFAQIDKAFRYADTHHNGQLRKDGSPFITHPLAVAQIIAEELRLDSESIEAALMHDCIEDTSATYAEIAKEFSPAVADLVEGVSKLTRVQYASKEEEQMENLRKMLMAMAKDIRVILIKLADRTHNMRTMEYQTPEKQKQKSFETLEIYAPIAHRLGMQKMKWELEDLSLKYLDPISYREIVDALDEKATEYDGFMSSIHDQITQRLEEAHIDGYVYGRMKHPYSIYRKMYTQNKSLDDVYDLFAFRVIVDTVSDCYYVLGIIHDLYKPVLGRFKDYIGTPKPNMYQSLHTTVMGQNGVPFEVQIRTKEMHEVAEYGIAAHWKYKQNGQGGGDEGRYEWVRRLLENQEGADAEEFIHSLKVDMFADEVFVFTPRGDVINLPAGATPIDFAYNIHSAVGNHMVAAKVNGRIVPFDCRLKNGDIVEVVTSQSAHGPSRDWVKIARSSNARSKIRQWLKRERRDENVVTGRASFESELKRCGVSLKELTNDENLPGILKKLTYKSLDDLYAAIGYGGISSLKVIGRIREDIQRILHQHQEERQAEVPLEGRPDATRPAVPKRTHSEKGIIVEGLSNCLVKFSKCCTPVPGDDIVGFITKGYGVSVHRKDCPNADPARRRPNEEGRWIKVSWAEDVEGTFRTTLQVVAKDRINLIVDISTVLSSTKTHVASMNARSTPDGFALITLDTDVSSSQQLKTVMRRIEQISGVMRVTRPAG